MSEHNHHGRGEQDRGRSLQDRRPYWKRAHHDWRFWVGMFLMFAAIAVYVTTDDLALVPRSYRISTVG